MSRGRKPGSMLAGSSTARLAALDVGDAFWLDTTPERWASDMRVALVPPIRRPPILAGRVFRSQVFTCVGSKTGHVRYAIRIERVA